MMLSSVSITIVNCKAVTAVFITVSILSHQYDGFNWNFHFDTKVKQVYHYSAFYFDLKVNI